MGLAPTAPDVPGFILGAIDRAVSDHGSSFDLVFIIDRTGSMTDDISTVRNAVDRIISYIEDRGEGTVRVGLFVYGDHCEDPEPFGIMDLTTDFGRFKRTLLAFSTTGGGDLPESAYEAVVGAMEHMSWSHAARYAILIGDAGPHQPGDPCYSTSLDDAVNAAAVTGVQVNIYPILVGL